MLLFYSNLTTVKSLEEDLTKARNEIQLHDSLGMKSSVSRMSIDTAEKLIRIGSTLAGQYVAEMVNQNYEGPYPLLHSLTWEIVDDHICYFYETDKNGIIHYLGSVEGSFSSMNNVSENFSKITRATAKDVSNEEKEE